MVKNSDSEPLRGSPLSSLRALRIERLPGHQFHQLQHGDNNCPCAIRCQQIKFTPRVNHLNVLCMLAMTGMRFFALLLVPRESSCLCCPPWMFWFKTALLIGPPNTKLQAPGTWPLLPKPTSLRVHSHPRMLPLCHCFFFPTWQLWKHLQPLSQSSCS